MIISLIAQMSEWTGGSNINYGFQDRKYGAGKFAGGAGGSQYAYLHDEEENSFQLVDTTRTQRPMYARGRFLRNQRMQRGRNQNQRNSQPVPLGKGKSLRFSIDSPLVHEDISESFRWIYTRFLAVQASHQIYLELLSSQLKFSLFEHDIISLHRD